MQQHTETTLKRSLDKQDERGNKTHFGGMYRFLHKKISASDSCGYRGINNCITMYGESLYSKICKNAKRCKSIQNDIQHYIYLSIQTSYVRKKLEKNNIGIHLHQKATYARKAEIYRSSPTRDEYR